MFFSLSRKWSAVAALFAGSLLVTNAQAQAQVPAQAEQPVVATNPTQDPRNFFFALTTGLTAGGDKLATIYYSNGDQSSVKGGGLFSLGLGVLWEPALTPVAVQATINYHFDKASADNGEVTFSRVPIEVLAYYTGLPNWRLGGGARFVRDAKLKVDFLGNNEATFKDTVGLVLEGGYRVGPHSWINLRYTAEKYEPDSFNGQTSFNGQDISNLGKYSGNSIGLNFVLAF